MTKITTIESACRALAGWKPTRFRYDEFERLFSYLKNDTWLTHTIDFLCEYYSVFDSILEGEGLEIETKRKDVTVFGEDGLTKRVRKYVVGVYEIESHRLVWHSEWHNLNYESRNFDSKLNASSAAFMAAVEWLINYKE